MKLITLTTLMVSGLLLGCTPSGDSVNISTGASNTSVINANGHKHHVSMYSNGSVVHTWMAVGDITNYGNSYGFYDENTSTSVIVPSSVVIETFK